MSRSIPSFLIPCLSFCLASCNQFVTPTLKHKIESYEIHKSAWKLEESPADYGRARSALIFSTGDLHVEEDGSERIRGVVISGKGGLASIITADGYALTAAHCLDAESGNSILGSRRPDFQGSRPHIFRSVGWIARDDGSTQRLPDMGFDIAAYPRLKANHSFTEKGALVGLPVRLVHRFPKRDLALIKLPLHNARYFPIAQDPSPNTVLFSSGNASSDSPLRTAGTLVRKRRRGSALIDLPQAPGDSGGPIFDSLGRLVGITSGITFSLKPHESRFTSTIAETVSEQGVAALVAEDRKRSLKRP